MSDRIVFLCQFFYPEFVSSAVLPTQLAEGLVQRGYQVDVICGEPHEFYDGPQRPKREVYQGITINRVRYSAFKKSNKIGRLINFFSFFLAVLYHFFELKRYQVLVVYSNPPILPLIGYWAAILFRIKLVFVGFDLYPDNALALKAIKHGGLIDRLMYYINKRVYTRSDRIIAISKEMKEILLKKHSFSNPGKIVVIPNWYTGDVQISNHSTNQKIQQLRDLWKLIVLYSGNFGEAQDLETITTAILQMHDKKIHQDVLFVFAGHGSKYQEIKSRFHKSCINNIQFFEFLHGQDYIDIMNISDICLTSLKQGIEGLGVPSKTYGYLAFGKPVISIMAFDTEIASDIVAFNAGECINQSETDKFIELIDRYSRDPEILALQKIGSARLHREKYAKDIALDRYFQLFDQLKSEGILHV